MGQLCTKTSSNALGLNQNFHEDYELQEKLGKGAFAITYKCRHRRSEKAYAVKVIQKKTILKNKVNRAAFDREIKILEVLKENPHVVTLEALYEDQRAVYVVQQLCYGGQLLDAIVEKNRISERETAKYIRQILIAVAECHLNGVVHRDLKPDNFLFASKEKDTPLVLIDFGLAAFFKSESYLSDPVGTAYYVAPEVLSGKYGPQCDVWSIGVIAFCLMSGRYPFWGSRYSTIFTAIRRSNPDFRGSPWPRVSEQAKDFLKKCLQKKPSLRITASQALSHPWIRSEDQSDVPLDYSVLSQLKAFSQYNKLKKLILRNLAMQISTKELIDLRDQFVALDADRTGTISYNELINAIHQMRSGSNKHQVIPEEQVQTILDGLDDNGDGQIDYIEFLAATLHVQQLERADPTYWQHQTRILFSKFDVNDSGFLNVRDIKGLINAESKEVIQILQEIDDNQDGMIDYDHFCKLIHNYSFQTLK